MSEAPKTIIVHDADKIAVAGEMVMAFTKPTPRSLVVTQTLYRRADLPATDEQAFANEKVKALVETLRFCATGNQQAILEARAALAAMEKKR